jgi:protein-tyrosine kinase
MAESGKIEAAIERLKQMKDLSGASSQEVRSARRAVANGAPKRFASVPPEMQELPVVEYDRKRCAQHRILVSDGSGPQNPNAVSAYRQLRTRILHRARSHSWTAIGVTSPGPGQGKTVNAINLALNVAREKNNNVFLLDLDLRNPSVCKYLGVQPPQELLGFFTGTAKPADVFFSIGVENLMLAGSTSGIDQSSELLATGRVEELFGYIRKVAPQPLIVIDMPPVLSNDDALVVAPKVDAMLVVVSEGVSRRDAVQQTLDLLGEFNLAGVLMNRSKSLVADYYGA